jgi:hypothetical protein
MLTVNPTTDVDYIDSIMHHPEVMPGLVDDFLDNPSMESSGPALAKFHNVVLRVDDGGTGQGWIWFLDRGNRSWEAHTALLPCCRGAKAVRAAKLCVRWMFDHEDCDEVVSYAWSDSPKVLLFARWVGLAPFKTEPYPATRNGKKVDITWMSVYKQKFLSTNN